ncbi:beta-1,6-N-acetylglucosaminyl transferase-like [Hibiscus trionum]|uniref:Beta-1,6-N-acetylglucosaminyl transferase-like n=1 Tax=Hibiscus trionum TaxID=183268 RepID=A0A9W7H445_HIBTR|nr:beta-1,6-N-acetylglucosaminyl transferase-like [Hibiscus trionum]
MFPSPSSSSPPILYSFTLFVSLFFLFLFAPQIFPPRNRHHRQPLISAKDELDDLHLFREAISKAKATPTSRGGSSKISHLGTINPNPKIAFLFLTNSDLVFAPLWQRFFESSNADLFNVYVHADPSTKLSTPEWLVKANFIPAKTTARASPTLISAARRLMANAIIDDPFNLYFALVSQHCIPLHSFKFVYASLFGNPSSAPKAFLTQRSHKSYIEILSEAPYLHNRYVARGDGSLLPEIPYDNFRVGSQFFVLAKRHALLVLKERKLWRKFKQPCLDLDSCYPEEHYFPTLLSMEDPKGSSLYTLTRVNWTDSVDGHPHTYLSPEISPELIHTLRKSNSSFSYFFARKFSPECLQPLMEIAIDVIFRD